ncbi:hypothetical protein RB195_009899 [Necator americanus]|uniref:Uncharacterized protein n=1 Tax=Necator americanus TaxID=51031 RepID=A0ABR1CVG2_NECAM
MLASEAAIEDLMMQAKKTKYDVIGLTETRRRHPLNAVYETGEDLFLGACDSRGVGGAAVLVNTSMANIDSFEQLTTQIGRLWMRRCGQTPVLTIFVAYAPTSNYEEKVEAFYVDLKKFYREDHVFYEVNFNEKVGPRRTPEELHIGIHGLQWTFYIVYIFFAHPSQMKNAVINMFRTARTVCSGLEDLRRKRNR